MTSVLRDIRKSLGFSIDEVAAEAGWSKRRFNALESSDEPDAAETLALNDLYGVDLDQLLDGAVSVQNAQPLSTLLRAQHDDVSAATRFAIAHAASVARDVRRLQERLGLANGWETIQRFPASHNCDDPGVAEKLARDVRAKLGLGPHTPIKSMTGVLKKAGVLLLWTKLDREVDAFSMATAELGGVIVANINGRHMRTSFQRRVTFAHELCHILFDRPRMAALERFCVAGSAEEQSENLDNIESRARAFPAYFLAPRTAVERIWRATGSERAKINTVMDTFGLGYEATRHHLQYLDQLPLSAKIDGPRLPTRLEKWERDDTVPHGDTVSKVVVECGVDTMRARALLPLLKSVPDAVAREALRANPEQWDQIRTAAVGQSSRVWGLPSSASPDDEFTDDRD